MSVPVDRRSGGFAAGVLLLLAVLLPTLCMVPAAEAEGPAKLWKKGQNCGEVSRIVEGECSSASETESGERLIETSISRGAASDPAVPGHLFVSDQFNARLVELSAWGDFVKAWGWGVRDGSPELQSCTAETGCRRGLAGGGKGQLTRPQGVAVDSAGNVFVAEGDFANRRVQKFDSEGNFLLMFGGDVNKTKVEEVGSTEAERNRCTALSGDVCQAATEGSGNGQFGPWLAGSFVAVGPGDTIYVGDSERIQVFDDEGEYTGNVPDPEGLLTGKAVQSLAVDSNGDAYVALAGEEDVLKLNPSGTRACAAEVASPTAITAASDVGFYVVSKLVFNSEVIEFDSDCNETDPFGSDELIASTGIATGSACYAAGSYGLYVTNSTQTNSFIRAYGPAPDRLDSEGDFVCPPPELAPSIDAQYATSVGTEDATLGAQINPKLWADTTYFLQYGTSPCSEGGCAEQPLAPGSELGAGAVDEDIATPGVFLKGLAPGTTYHYRFVAQSSGGGPVYGVGANKVHPEGEEATFRTYPEPEAPARLPRKRSLPHRPIRRPARLPGLRDGLPGRQRRRRRPCHRRRRPPRAEFYLRQRLHLLFLPRLRKPQGRPLHQPIHRPPRPQRRLAERIDLRPPGRADPHRRRIRPARRPLQSLLPQSHYHLERQLYRTGAGLRGLRRDIRTSTAATTRPVDIRPARRRSHC